MSPFSIFTFESGVWQLNNKIKYLHCKNHLGKNINSETLFQPILLASLWQTEDRDEFHPSPICVNKCLFFKKVSHRINCDDDSGYFASQFIAHWLECRSQYNKFVPTNLFSGSFSPNEKSVCRKYVIMMSSTKQKTWAHLKWMFSFSIQKLNK